MGTKTPHHDPRDEGPGGDPWAAFGYLVAGVVFYGGIGYGLSVWLDASYLLPIGILVGVGFGFYLVFNTYRFRGDQHQMAKGPTDPTDNVIQTSSTPIEHDRPDDAGRDRSASSDRDDRGDSS